MTLMGNFALNPQSANFALAQFANPKEGRLRISERDPTGEFRAYCTKRKFRISLPFPQASSIC